MRHVAEESRSFAFLGKGWRPLGATARLAKCLGALRGGQDTASPLPLERQLTGGFQEDMQVGPVPALLGHSSPWPPSPLDSSLSPQSVDLMVSGGLVTGIPQPRTPPAQDRPTGWNGQQSEVDTSPWARQLRGSFDLVRRTPSWFPLIGQLIPLTSVSQGIPSSVLPTSRAWLLPPGLDL